MGALLNRNSRDEVVDELAEKALILVDRGSVIWTVDPVGDRLVTFANYPIERNGRWGYKRIDESMGFDRPCPQRVVQVRRGCW